VGEALFPKYGNAVRNTTIELQCDLRGRRSVHCGRIVEWITGLPVLDGLGHPAPARSARDRTAWRPSLSG